MYHRPDGLEDAAGAGIGLMLCGHTHNGQIVPFNRLVKRCFPRIAGRCGDDLLFEIPVRSTVASVDVLYRSFDTSIRTRRGGPRLPDRARVEGCALIGPLPDGPATGACAHGSGYDAGATVAAAEAEAWFEYPTDVEHGRHAGRCSRP